MLKKSLLLLFFIAITWIIYSTPILLDDVTIDLTTTFTADASKKNLRITIYNLRSQDINSLQVIAKNKRVTDFSIREIKKNKVIGLLIDNSGSIILNDFYDILNKTNIFIKSMSKDDRLIVWKVNDFRTKLYSFSPPTPSLGYKISKLVREGKKSRITDAMNESLKELNELIGSGKYSDFNFYLVLFSDGEDIGSKIKKQKDLVKTNVPFYYFSYPSGKTKFQNDIYKKISDKTRGKVIERPTVNSIKKIFFQNEIRYEISFSVSKSDILKSHSFEVVLKRNENDKTPLKFDLKKYFHYKKTNFPISLLSIIIAIILIFLIILVAVLFFRNKLYSFLSKNKIWSKTKSNLQTKDINNIKNVNLITKDDEKSIPAEEDMDITTLGEGKKISYQESGIIYKDKSRVQRDIEKFKKVYIDKPDHFGETLVIETLLVVKEIIGDFVICKSKMPFLLDEILDISALQFRIVKIVFVPQGKSFLITLESINAVANIEDIFRTGKEIIAKRTVNIYGSSDSVIAKIASQNYQNKKPEYSKPWRQAIVIAKGKNNIEIKTSVALSLDSTVVIRYANGIKEMFFRVKKVRMIDDSTYKVKLIEE